MDTLAQLLGFEIVYDYISDAIYLAVFYSWHSLEILQMITYYDLFIRFIFMGIIKLLIDTAYHRYTADDSARDRNLDEEVSEASNQKKVVFKMLRR